MIDYIQIHPSDTVAVALRTVPEGSEWNGVRTLEEIRQGHKVALLPMRKGDTVMKYGLPIGHATRDIAAGEWVHTHNMATNLSEETVYSYTNGETSRQKQEAGTFQGYRRPDGTVGIRNEIWIIPTVGCVNEIAKKLASECQELVNGSVEGIYAYTHPFGCSQTGEDHAQTKKLLASLARHPNAAAVLVLSLGCENLTQQQFLEALGTFDPQRIKFLICQEVADEMEAGKALLRQCADYASGFQREPIATDELVIGMKCGGSDGLSGVTANPVVGRFSDMFTAQGGTTVLTEVPEMFGAETLLLNRCINETVFQKAVDMVNGFKEYYIRHNEPVYENPSPGNKAGGITTLEDKSCGCVQKGGTSPITDVIDYGERIKTKGLNLLNGPGNDLISATALTAAGAHMVLFTTGRGTPFGAPAPTLKIATNTPLSQKKAGWIDYNAGTVADGTRTIDSAAEELMALVLQTASGRKSKNEENGFREIAIFKGGIVL